MNNNIDPSKNYIAVGLESSEAITLKDILTIFHGDHPDIYAEFVSKLRDGLQYQIDNALYLSGDVVNAMAGVVVEDDSVDSDNGQ